MEPVKSLAAFSDAIFTLKLLPSQWLSAVQESDKTACIANQLKKEKEKGNQQSHYVNSLNEYITLFHTYPLCMIFNFFLTVQSRPDM